MDKKNGEFQKRLLSTFKAEAEEHLKAIISGLIELEKDLSPEIKMEMIETVFREAHSLKGAARSVSMSDVEAICQSLESVFSALKRQEINLYPMVFDTLHQGVDTLNKMIFSPQGNESVSGDKIIEIKELLAKIEAGELIELKKPIGEIRGPAAEQVHPSTGTVRIAAEKMVGLLLQTEEIVAAKLALSHHVEDIRDLVLMFETWNKEWSKKFPAIQDFRRRLEKKSIKGNNEAQIEGQGLKLLEFIDSTQTHIKSIEGKLHEFKRQADHDRYSTGLMIDHLLEEVKKTLMLPFSALVETFPKLIRDLSHEQDKEVELQVSGEEVEIDRRILDGIRNPFIHLIRNSLDHGIEKPEERVSHKKKRAGKVNIVISRIEGNKVEIVFSDDGRGIDLQKVKEISVKRGFISPTDAEKLSEQEIVLLTFQSGVSTSSFITDISGRGLGLAIVREKIQQLGGQVSIESRPKEGTSFTIVIPVTLATFRGVLVKGAEQLFVIPTAHIERVIRTKRDEIKTVENRETISLNGLTVPVLRLSDVLELSAKQEEGLFVQVLVVELSGKRIGFVIDEVLNEQEFLIKNFNQYLSRIRNVAGATILGSGKVVPILNVSDLMMSAMKSSIGLFKADISRKEEVEEKKLILVVEDSITSRMLLKNILESSGYTVKTAVDGIDAVTQLKTETFDLVVSDVDMPRMNGFDLTAKIRSDKKLSETPVVLVTALEARADRERGIDVGANAYIVKSSFDQSNLLEVVRRLI